MMAGTEILLPRFLLKPTELNVLTGGRSLSVELAREGRDTKSNNSILFVTRCDENKSILVVLFLHCTALQSWATKWPPATPELRILKKF